MKRSQQAEPARPRTTPGDTAQNDTASFASRLGPGLITGAGLAANIGKMCPRWLTLGLVALLVVANTINIAADLAAMAEAVKLLAGGPHPLYVLAFGALCIGTQIGFSYERSVR